MNKTQEHNTKRTEMRWNAFFYTFSIKIITTSISGTKVNFGFAHMQHAIEWMNEKNNRIGPDLTWLASLSIFCLARQFDFQTKAHNKINE